MNCFVVYLVCSLCFDAHYHMMYYKKNICYQSLKSDIIALCYVMLVTVLIIFFSLWLCHLKSLGFQFIKNFLLLLTIYFTFV